MDMFSLWERILSYVETNNAQYYEMFLSQLSPYSFVNGVFVIAANKRYLISLVKNLYTRQIESLVAEATGAPARLEVILNPNASGEAPAQAAVPASPQPAPAPSFPASSAPEETPAPFRAAPFPASSALKETPAPFGAAPFPEEIPERDAPLTPPIDVKNIRPRSLEETKLPSIEEKLREEKTGRQEMSLFGEAEPAPAPKAASLKTANTFENFVFGNCNRMAYEASLAVAKQVSTDDYNRSFNPLFIYGPSGLGKTHLLHAIQHYIMTHGKNKKVIVMPSESFVNEMITSIKNNTSEKFRQKYRTVDVLLLDDIQFFTTNRESSALELFNTFNVLFENQKNIVMTSDTTPENIKDMEDRLKSRFASGLVVQISPPDFEICCAILERNAETDGIELPRDVVEFVARHINKNVRILEGAYNTIKAFCRVNNTAITIETAKAALQKSEYIKSTKELTMDLIIDTVCRRFDVPRAKLLGKSRPKNIVVPRQIAMYLCRNDLGEPFQSIADVFHKNDHTSVLQACRRVEKGLESDPLLKKNIEELRDLLKNQ